MNKKLQLYKKNAEKFIKELEKKYKMDNDNLMYKEGERKIEEIFDT